LENHCAAVSLTDGNWALFPNHAREPVAYITAAADGMYLLLIGAGHAGPYTKAQAFDLGLAHARNKLIGHKQCA
jgi:hypothetical protein